MKPGMNLVKGHPSALEALQNLKWWSVHNLGVGRGYGVLEMIKEYQEVCQLSIFYIRFPGQLGDVSTCFADVSEAIRFCWHAKRSLAQMC